MVGRGRGGFFVSKRGLTLLEIIGGLALFSILTAVALPGLTTLLPAYRLRSSARQLQSELHKIKMQAVSENVGFQLSFEEGAADYSILRDNSPWTTKPLPEGIEILKTGRISFSPHGTAGGDRVRLRNAQSACRQVVVSSTGRIRVCKPANCNETC
ncbi:MAG: GspH/FimT family pseudopilin [Deltaproteobacteria bacterium]|nr:GspH/FimT family pseudopilin [Deltaproteobacteria bacterium]